MRFYIYILFFFLFYSNLNYSQAVNTEKSEVHQYYDNVIDALDTLSSYKELIGKIDKYLTTKISIYDKGLMYELLGRIYMLEENSSLSKLNFKEAAKNFKAADSLFDYVYSINKLGMLYTKNSDYEKALNYYFEVLSIAEKEGYNKIKLRTLNDIGVIYYQKNQDDDALSFFNQVVDAAKNMKDSLKLAHVYNNIGLIHDRNEDYDKAFEFYDKTLELSKLISYTHGEAMVYNNKAMIYYKQKKLDECLSFLNKSLEMVKKEGNKQAVAIAMNNIGYLYLTNNQIDKGIEFLQKSLEISTEINYKYQMALTYENLAEGYELIKDYKQAYIHQKKYATIKDTILNEQRERQVNELQIKYETEKKDNQIQLLNKEKEFDKLKIKSQKRLLYYLIVIIALVVGVVVFAYREYLIKKKNNKKLLELNHELEKLSIVAAETDNSVVIADKNGNLIWANAAFERITGYTYEEFIRNVGRNMKDTSSCESFKDYLNVSIGQKKSVSYTSKMKNKHGKYVFIQTTLTPYFVSGELDKLIAIDSDITQIKLAEEEVRQQNEEIQAQRDEIFRQKEKLEESNILLEDKNQKITDSIHYAKRIQSAILPDNKIFDDYFRDYFIFFKPRDIVSGDFYWTAKTEKHIFVAAVDCTGHGIPGAFMSMIGNSLLNELVLVSRIENTDEILNQLNRKVIDALNQNKDALVNDGMDLALIRIDKNSNKLQTSGAGRPALIFDGKKYHKISNSNFSIGEPRVIKKNLCYKSTDYQFEDNQICYLFSDGMPDQFNEKDDEKFSFKRIQQIFSENNQLECSKQKEIIENEFNKWKGNNKQIDDILVMGLRLKT